MTLEPLMKFAGPSPNLPGCNWAEAISGKWAALTFFVTVDHDGQIEASLSRAGGLPATPVQSKAFFRMWGVKPTKGRQDMKMSSHWVVKLGRGRKSYDGPRGRRHAGIPTGAGAMNRTDILDAARQAVTVDRAATHGQLEDSFGLVAAYWSAHLGTPVSRSDVAVMMIQLKLARIKTSPEHADHWIDVAGYAACGGEVAVK